MDILINFLYYSVRAGTPLLLGTTGEIITEKSGSLNLGVEGLMAMGAIGGYVVGCATNNFLFGVLGAFLFGLLGALIFAFVTEAMFIFPLSSAAPPQNCTSQYTSAEYTPAVPISFAIAEKATVPDINRAAAAAINLLRRIILLL